MNSFYTLVIGGGGRRQLKTGEYSGSQTRMYASLHAPLAAASFACGPSSKARQRLNEYDSNNDRILFVRPRLAFPAESINVDPPLHIHHLTSVLIIYIFCQ